MVKKSLFQRFFSWVNSGIKRIHPLSYHYHTHYGKNIKFETQIFNYINNERQKRGLHALQWNDSLYTDSQRRAREITHHFCHECIPHGCGKNIAKVPLGNVWGIGYVGRKNLVRSFVKTWMKSTGHREDILRSNYSSSCIGIAKHGRYYYAVQLFQ
jgi:uncharacterized protein YkwD